MDEIGDEFNDTSGDDKTGEELPELTSESDEPDEFDDEIPEIFSEPDEFDDEIPEVFSEPDEFDDEIPEVFSEPDEFDDEIPEVFSEPDEFDDEIPEVFSEPDEFDDEIPEIFSEPDEFDDILDDTIQEKEVGERADEDQDSGDVGNVIENENIGSQSTSTVLTSEIEEIDSNMEHQEQKEEIEIRPEEYQDDTEPIVNTDESEFIKDVEELAEQAREIKAEGEDIGPQAEKENAAYYAEQYYEKIKEKEVINEQNSKEEQETEELRQEVAEELKGDQESSYKSAELEEEATIEASKEITSTEEFEYLWGVRERIDREGKSPEEIEEVMHEAEEMYETLKNAEKLYEEQELEKLKLVNHEDEASEEDLKEDLDRIDLVEQAVELEDKLVQQGKLQEEIDVRVEESIEETLETTKFEEKIEKIIEKERKDLINREDEESVEKEDVDRVDLIEQAVELEEKLVLQGESQEEIDVRVEKSIEETLETTKFEEKIEKIFEEQELEKLKLVDHEDEASEEDLKEELDRIDLVEQVVELEEKLVQQGKSQEEIDTRVEEAIGGTIETAEFEEKLENINELEQESIVNEKLKKHDLEINEQNSNENVENKENLEVLKPELDAIESESENKKDLLEEDTKLRSEESEEEENEHLQELYRQETGRRPMYSRQKTKGYSQWLEQRELRSEKIKNSKSESEKKKEIEEEGWKTTLKRWIKEASEEECNAELKSELKKALENYNEFEYLTRKFLELYKKSQKEKLTEIEKNSLKSLTERLQELGPIQLELLANIRAFKDYFNNHLWELMNRFFVIRVRSKFFEQISQKYENLKHQMLKLKELINSGTEKTLMNPTSSELSKYSQQEIDFFDKHGINVSKFKNRWGWIEGNHTILESYFKDIIIPCFKHVPSSSELKKNGYARLVKYIYSMYPNYKEFVSKVINEEERKKDSSTKKIFMNQISKSGGIIRIFKFKPIVLVKIIEQLGRNIKVILEIKDEIYLQKKKKYTYSSSYSDGDIEFWIELYKLKYYGGSWPAVFNFIIECNNRFNLKIDIPHYYNGMIPIVKVYCKHNSLNYEDFLIKHGIHKSKQPPTDEIVFEWIKIYQDREVGGSISAIMKYLENYQGYSFGETTIRRHIKKFFRNGKYTHYFDTEFSYEEWIKMYKRNYFRENMPLDPKTQSHEYILLYNTKNNQYQRVFIKDIGNPELLENLDELQILGISNKLQPKKVNINRFEKEDLQESLEIVCSHGSVIISPDQYLFTIDDDCNIIEIKGSDLKVGVPILMPRILKIDSNDEPLDLINCGKLITSNTTQYIEQFGKKAYRFIKKNANLGAIIGQYEAEGTFPSKYQPATTISVSVDTDYILKLQKLIKEVFGLEFHLIKRRIEKCKNCGHKTVEKGKQNICPKCEDGIYNEYYELRTKTKLAKIIFTEGLGLKHAYSYLKEIPSFLYNSPTECEKGFILGYFKGDGSELDYRNKGGSFSLNFETTSRRLVFGLKFLLMKLGVIMSVSEHNPPSTRPNSKNMYSMFIRGSSNFEKLKQCFNNLPDIDYTTSDIKTSVNTQVLLRKLNLELQKMYGISLRELNKKGIVPKNAVHIATQLKRKTNLSEVLLLKTLDGLKNEKISTPLVKKLEQVFRNNTFTKIKKIRDSKTPNDSYKISVEGLGYCSGTTFIYVKSKESK